MKINACVKNRGPLIYLKTGTQWPSSSRRKRSSQPSSELSTSEECLVAEKGRENGRKEEKTGELEP